MKITRRLGSTPQQRGSLAGGDTCPDIFELEDGNFLIIGKDVKYCDEPWPPEVSMADDEWAVCIPRRVLLDAKKDIPDAHE